MLHDRRKQAHELLKWKKRLDEEEKKVFHLEKKAIEVWHRGRDGREGRQSGSGKHAAAASGVGGGSGKHGGSGAASGKPTAGVSDGRNEEAAAAKKCK